MYQSERLIPQIWYKVGNRSLCGVVLRKIHLHDLRHTFCSLALNEYNIPVSIVSKSAGHSNIEVTLNTYSHSDEKMQKKTADAFEEHIFSELKKNG